MSAPSTRTTAVGLRAAQLDAVAAAWTVLSTAYGRLPETGFVDAMRSPTELAQWPYDDRESAGGVTLLLRSGERAASGCAIPRWACRPIRPT